MKNRIDSQKKTPDRATIKEDGRQTAALTKISACLVVRNEEKVIERCLNSLKGAVDEILIVHDGECGDNTLKIAKKFNADIFIRPMAGVMEAIFRFYSRKLRVIGSCALMRMNICRRD